MLISLLYLSSPFFLLLPGGSHPVEPEAEERKTGESPHPILEKLVPPSPPSQDEHPMEGRKLIQGIEELGNEEGAQGKDKELAGGERGASPLEENEKGEGEDQEIFHCGSYPFST